MATAPILKPAPGPTAPRPAEAETAAPEPSSDPGGAQTAAAPVDRRAAEARETLSAAQRAAGWAKLQGQATASDLPMLLGDTPAPSGPPAVLNSGATPAVNGGFHRETETYAYPRTAAGQPIPADQLEIAGPLGLTWADVKQGLHAKDCVGLSILASLASRNPEAITQRVRPATDAAGKPLFDAQGYPLFRITLQAPNGQPWVYTTNAQLPAGKGQAASHYGAGVAAESDGKYAIGVPLLQKALVAYNDQFHTMSGATEFSAQPSSGYGDFGAMDGNGVTQALLGTSLPFQSTAAMTLADFTQAVAGAAVAVTGIGTPGIPPGPTPSGAKLTRHANGAYTYTAGGVDYTIHTGHQIAVLGVHDGVVALYDQWPGSENGPQPIQMPFADFQAIYGDLGTAAVDGGGAAAQGATAVVGPYSGSAGGAVSPAPPPSTAVSSAAAGTVAAWAAAVHTAQAEGTAGPEYTLAAHWADWGTPKQGTRAQADGATYARGQVLSLARQGDMAGAGAAANAAVAGLFAILNANRAAAGSPEAAREGAWVLAEAGLLQTTLAAEGLPPNPGMAGLMAHAQAAVAAQPSYAGWQMPTAELAKQADGASYQQQRTVHALAEGQPAAAVQAAYAAGGMLFAVLNGVTGLPSQRTAAAWVKSMATNLLISLGSGDVPSHTPYLAQTRSWLQGVEAQATALAQ